MAGMYQRFGDGGYRLRPNVSGTADTLQGRYSVFTNSLGLRCAGQNREIAPGPVDILVLGDSLAFGNGLNFEDTLVGQFAAKAAARGLRVENAAVGGQYLANQFELLRWLDAHGVRPRRILLFLSPYLIATAGEYMRVTVGQDGRLYSRGRGPGVTSWLKTNTVIYGRLRNAVNSLVPLAKDELTPLAVKIYLKSKEADYRGKTLSSLETLTQWVAGTGSFAVDRLHAARSRGGIRWRPKGRRGSRGRRRSERAFRGRPIDDADARHRALRLAFDIGPACR